MVVGILVLLAVLIVVVATWLAGRPVPPLQQGMADADEIKIAAKISGRIEAFAVREGDRVEAGQALYTIDSPELNARRRQAEAALATAQAMLDKAEEGARSQEITAARAQWERAEAGAVLARATYARMRNLFEEGVISRQQHDESEANALAVTAQAKAARAQYEQALEGARDEDRRAAASQVRQAEAAVAEIAAMLEETRMRAPFAGLVNKRLADPGELVPAGYPVLTLLDPASTWVGLYVREDRFSGWRVGTMLEGEVPALGLQGVPFEVYFISPAGDFATWRATRSSDGYDVKAFEIRLRPVDALPDLRPGMSVLFGDPG
ncbi:MAG: HlyD family secretion protein [Gammaproteobacteria bacterium]